MFPHGNVFSRNKRTIRTTNINNALYHSSELAQGVSYKFLFLGAELVLTHSAEGALEIVADFFPLLALLVFIKDPAANVTDIFHWVFLLRF